MAEQLPELKVAMALINQVDVYHLQRRTGPEKIDAAGLVGCFGGKRKPGETPKQAIVRELPEETTLDLTDHRLREIDEFSVESDHNLVPVDVHMTVIEVLMKHGETIEAKEGELVTWTQDEIQANEDQLTPATKEFFARYFN